MLFEFEQPGLDLGDAKAQVAFDEEVGARCLCADLSPSHAGFSPLPRRETLSDLRFGSGGSVVVQDIGDTCLKT